MAVMRSAFRLLLVLWTGSLWSLALWMAPTVFSLQSDRHLAGVLVTRLFSYETYLGLAVAILAALMPWRRRFVGGYLAVGLLAINEGILKPIMSTAHIQGAVAGLGFGAWHGLSALLYVGACLIMAVVMDRGQRNLHGWTLL